MRKLAPAFILTTIVALSSGSALALGDMNKSKKAPSASTATTTDAVSPAEKTYTSPTNPASNNAATDTGMGGATSRSSPNTGTAPMSPTSNSVSSSGHDATVATDNMAVNRPRKWSAKDCQGLATTDPIYKSNHCGSVKGDSAAGGN